MPTEETPLPEKRHDMVTGLIEMPQVETIGKFSEYTGTDKDGSTDGIIKVCFYLHVASDRTIVGLTRYMVDGVVQAVPDKLSDYITGPIQLTNAQRAGGFTYNGTLEDGSTDGSIV
jgi:hypothetical protein